MASANQSGPFFSAHFYLALAEQRAELFETDAEVSKPAFISLLSLIAEVNLFAEEIKWKQRYYNSKLTRKVYRQ